MAAQKGKDLLIKIDPAGGGVFETVAGLRASRIALNAETVDATTADSAGRWRELLAGAGARSAAISGSGVFKDATSDAMMRQAFFDGVTLSAQIIVPGFGIIEGPFQLTALEYSGDHDGEATFEASLASAGSLSFTAI
ncbi:phage major tail protein, TP901-1 family [Pikeienuella piscinae]|uniref:Phage major tail protein, TP901-1 family n=1 Tax=Pikeienuella piscinae TaxID=2748098 RepID=A0A7L5BVI3_9RHOB|nr:phage major tail protein, TP901-1 family [Pikeienuella piscinae]QIE54507.1 phage major tail protein, TP901-1 family [Pikeienuella piscinae]